jgi:hypothetical protein
MAWIFFNDAFISVVAPTPGSVADREDKVCVRARLKGHLEKVFGDHIAVEEGGGRDYRFRTLLPRRIVAQVIADRILEIDYGNFKDSVKDKPLHDAYLRVWGVMHSEQVREGGKGWEAYSGNRHAGNRNRSLATPRRRRKAKPHDHSADPFDWMGDDADDFLFKGR